MNKHICINYVLYNNISLITLWSYRIYTKQTKRNAYYALIKPDWYFLFRSKLISNNNLNTQNKGEGERGFENLKFIKFTK